MKRDTVEARGSLREQNEERDGCRLVTLARNNVAHVQRCVQCGAIALHLGPVTLRFDEGRAGVGLERGRSSADRGL